MNRRAVISALRKVFGSRQTGMVPRGSKGKWASSVRMRDAADEASPAMAERLNRASGRLRKGALEPSLARARGTASPSESMTRSSITGKTNYGEDMQAPMARANNANPISAVDQEFGGAAPVRMSRRQGEIEKLKGEIAQHDEWFRSVKEAREAGENIDDIYGGAYARRRNAQAKARYRLSILTEKSR